MAKGDSPPFLMKVDGGRLAPATAWEAERLASYRNGSTVNVVITQEAASWRRRKYWAVLGKVVETCPVKPRTAQDLHDAIRREIGFVDAFHSDGKSLRVTLRSTSKLDEPAFDAFYREAMEVLTEWTGLDAETLGKEAADVGHDEHEQSGAQPHAPSDSGSGDEAQAAAPDQSEIGSPPGERIPSGGDEPMEASPSISDREVGEVSTESAAADLQEGGEQPGPAGDDAPPSGDPRGHAVILSLKAEAVEKFLAVATDPKVPDPHERRGVLAKTKDAWKKEMPGHPEFVRTCTTVADKVIKGVMPIAEAREYLSGLVK